MNSYASRSSLALLACGVAALVAGCGGGSSSTATSASGLSHSDWVAHADAVCERDHETNATRATEFGALLKEGLTTPAARAEAAELVAAAEPAVKQEVEEIAALDPPAEDEALAREVVEGIESMIAIDRRFAAALAHGSTAELKAVSAEGQQNGNVLKGLALKLGLKVCGRPEAS